MLILANICLFLGFFFSLYSHKRTKEAIQEIKDAEHKENTGDSPRSEPSLKVLLVLGPLFISAGVVLHLCG